MSTVELNMVIKALTEKCDRQAHEIAALNSDLAFCRTNHARELNELRDNVAREVRQAVAKALGGCMFRVELVPVTGKAKGSGLPEALSNTFEAVSERLRRNGESPAPEAAQSCNGQQMGGCGTCG